ncbi:helix-turn-helix domain-containing protein [Paracoccus limosus]|uniref:Helix-turn-helix domain-containing protein n=1 Tax=Paracoccus limosus TaxID=913252 RepID=A0A844H9U2_9RHOB|nr:helix-turn-helix domain-containing protein [Paracoccus limosus]
MISGEQIRGARALVGISGRELASLAGVSYPTIQRVEAQGTGKSAVATIDAIRRALEAQGVQFLESGQVAAGPGVALGNRP